MNKLKKGIPYLTTDKSGKEIIIELSDKGESIVHLPKGTILHLIGETVPYNTFKELKGIW